MHIEIGNEIILSETQAQEMDSAVFFQMQIGVTRIGRGGRCLPRTKRGAMTSVANLVASTVEVIETELRPVARKVAQVAYCARIVVSLALVVVVQVIKATVSESLKALVSTVKALVQTKTAGNLMLAAGFVGALSFHPVMKGFFHSVATWLIG